MMSTVILNKTFLSFMQLQVSELVFKGLHKVFIIVFVIFLKNLLIFRFFNKWGGRIAFSVSSSFKKFDL